CHVPILADHLKSVASGDGCFLDQEVDMKCSRRLLFLIAAALLVVINIGRMVNAQIGTDASGWDPKAAAAYLDGRAAWWTTWPNAARDRGTYCMSCHTTLPYALARPQLRGLLNERAPSPTEDKILDNLLIRARNWREVEPWYPDQTRGI